VKIIDANNCVKNISVFVPQVTDTTNIDPCANFNASINSDIASTDSVYCNGQISVVANGGDSPYNYSFDNAGFSSANVYSSLCPGNYSVVVIDANNCVDSLNVIISYNDSTINDPCTNFTANLQIFPTTDSSKCNGALNVIAKGGTMPYSYSWYNSTSNGPNATNLCFGNDTVTVVDANGCSVTLYGYVPFSLNQCANSTLQVALTSTNVSANANPCNGSISSMVSGGFGNYIYSWNNGATTASLSGVCSGIYSLNVKDSLGCMRATSIYVGRDLDSTRALNAYVIPTGVSEAGICNGTASVVAFGGVPPYSYSFDGGSTNQTATGLCPGLQNVTITDANGASLKLNFIISSPQNVIVNNIYKDSIVVDSLYNPAVSNCLIDYSTIDSIFISNLSFISADSVVVTWTVEYGSKSSVNLTNYYVVLNSESAVYTFVIQLYCPSKSVGQFLTASSQYYIDKSVLGLNSVTNNHDIFVFPNPFNDKLNVTVNSDSENTIIISDMLNKVVSISKSWSNSINIDTQNFSYGNYILTIVNEKGKFNYKIVK
jgi:hypothetical protein